MVDAETSGRLPIDRPEVERRSERSAMDRWMSRRTDIVIGAVGCAIWLAIALQHVWTQPIDHDARGYGWLAEAIVRGRRGSGVPAEFLDILFGIRLMGYPLFLAPFIALGLEGLSLRLAVATVQVAVFWASVLVARGALMRIGRPLAARRVTIALLALPFPYFVAVDLVTESISISLAIFVTAAVMRAVHSDRSRAQALWVAVASFGSGAAMLVRTDSLFVPCIALVGTFAVLRTTSRSNPSMQWVRTVRDTMSSAVIVGAAVLVFRIPHFFLLRANTGVGHWDTPTDVATQEFDFGVGTLKWATGIRSISGAFSYRNPFLRPEMAQRVASNPTDWYWHEPIRGAATIATKWFALVDQDVPFVYNDSIPSRPNVALFLLNHTMVALGVLGLVLLLRRLCTRSCPLELRWSIAAPVVGGAVWLATHALPHVESRYGLPALAALAATAGYWCSGRRLRRHARLVSIVLALYLPMAWIVSTWLITYRTFIG